MRNIVQLLCSKVDLKGALSNRHLFDKCRNHRNININQIDERTDTHQNPSFPIFDLALYFSTNPSHAFRCPLIRIIFYFFLLFIQDTEAVGLKEMYVL
jgi:hypothetical protein